MKTYFCVLIFCLSAIASAFAQNKNKYKAFDIRPNKGKIFVSFGWNRGYFTDSKINLKGEDYDFSLHGVKARDRQSTFDFGLYFHPETFTIPQTNLKVGYFFHDNYTVSFNIDHMKYVMVQNQTAKISGFISGTNTAYNGTYDNNDSIVLSKDFLTFEHTNGLNYLSLELNRHDDLLKKLHLENKWIEVSCSEGVSLGVITPKTDATLLGKPRNDVFYLAGYGFGVNADVSITFLQYLYFQFGLKGGFIHLPHVKTTASSVDKANQSFWFFEHIFSFGVKVRVFK
jgi:hypothetical protein